MPSNTARIGFLSCALFASTLAVIGVGSWQSAPADVRPLTQYEKVGRAPLVVWGEVTDGAHRFAVIKTLEVLKITIPERPGESFRIAYKLDSFLRTPWQDKISFGAGERVLLFLRKFTKEDGDQPEGDLYTLMWGAEGKVLLPAEGEDARVASARTFARIVAEADLDQQTRMLREGILSGNPFVSDGAFEEMLKQGLGDLQMIHDLVLMFDAPREPTRLFAMRMVRQIVGDAQVAGRVIPARQELEDLVRGRAVGDAAPAFRVEAVRTLDVLGGEAVKAFLQRLAKEDSSQLVRYEAEKCLTGWDSKK
ncbi:MAG TPA: HEAT repeat domain-containing protein [Patescibacteria group bacterium]|nr:HEAT repeat domain-containing protein [Patescibacteria group bacterium]